MTLIHELMDRRGTPLTQQGKWATGPCPKCGGEDRFRVVVNNVREYFTCRRCGAHGDAIQFLRDFEGLSFQEAKARADAHRGTSLSTVQAAACIEDDMRWFEANRDIIERASAYLQRSQRAQKRLREQRGIKAETAEQFSIGYIPELQRFNRADFGLPPRTREDSSVCPLYVPPGIAIPILLHEEELYGLQVRRDEPYRGQRYFTVPGSELRPMVLRGESGDTVIVVESYLCAFLLFQETEGRYTIIALGSANVHGDDETDAVLKEAGTVLVALDTDTAGARQAWNGWVKRYANAVRCPIPSAYGKDPTEAYLNGLDLNDWVEAGLALAEEERRTAKAQVLALGKARAAVKHVATEGEAQKAVEAICAACPAIGVALHVEPRAACAGHRQADWHPRFARVSYVAVYALALGKVFIFDMGAVKKIHLKRLWGLTVVCHDGVEILRHFVGLRKSGTDVESTLLMANTLSNKRLDIAKALDQFADLALPGHSDSGLDTACRALALSPLLDGLRDKMGRRVHRVYRRMRDTQRAVAAMEVAGIGFDAEGHVAIVDGWRAEQARCRGKLPAELDVGEDAAVCEWLQESLSPGTTSRMKRTVKDEICLSDASLARVGLPQVEALREYRRLDYSIRHYGGLADYADSRSGRIHSMFLVGGMITGRTSNRYPCLQNLPRDPAFRALIHAADGCKLVVIDVSQSQLRIAAEVSGDEAMLRAYARCEDLHSLTAAKVANVPISGVTKEQRQRAKAVNFGFLFGQRTRGFRTSAAQKFDVYFTEEEAAEMRDAFFRAYPGVAEWQRAALREAKRSGRCETPGGRTLRFDGPRRSAHKALAFVIQGAEAEIMLDALAALQPDLEAHGARLVHFIHDEIIVEAPEEREATDTVARLAERHITEAFLRTFPDASVDGLVETHIGDNWAEAK